MNDIFIRINKAIANYKDNLYSEEDFQSTLNSIVETITEYELLETKDFLRSIECDLEQINFMIEQKLRRNEYLKVINKMNNFIIKGP